MSAVKSNDVNAISYRGMMFTDDSMRKIIALKKTQTRRLIRLPKWMREKGGTLENVWADPGLGAGGYLKVPLPEDSSVQRLRCPFGMIGDRIWTKEAWYDNLLPRSPEDGADEIYYRANGIPCFEGEEAEIVWRSPFFMPRWASRATLEIVNVFPQPLQSISNDDAKAEGVCGVDVGGGMDYGGPADYRGPFRNVWQSLNAKRSPWERNDWVWAITFALVELKQ